MQPGVLGFVVMRTIEPVALVTPCGVDDGGRTGALLTTMADEQSGKPWRESWAIPFLAGLAAVFVAELFQRFVWDLEQALADLPSSQFWPVMAVLGVGVAALYLVMRRTRPPEVWPARLVLVVVLAVFVVVLLPSSNALFDRVSPL